ncbi:hypothetical protein JNK62_01965 [bacterium]|nr:hypothetical protein [bacterium]
MFRQVILALVAFIVIVLLVMWIIGGGPRRAYEDVTSVEFFPFSHDTATGFRLPWQPAQLFPTIDITGAFQVTEGDYSSSEYELAELEAEYERLSREAATSRTIGTPSPYRGSVSIVSDVSGVRGESANDEYVQIAVSYEAKESVDMTGWVLESALSGSRAYLPAIASPFYMGAANVSSNTLVAPGGLAIVTTGASPVGASFRENMCSGYLDQFQQFQPQLGNECPSPSTVLPLTQENLVQYGDACFDVIQNLSSCRFPQDIPDTVNYACRAFITDALSHNGCVNRNRTNRGFETNRWRLFLGGQAEIWRNSHDAIRLLDREGRTVDVYVY